jgi:hypothetical protein
VVGAVADQLLQYTAQVRVMAWCAYVDALYVQAIKQFALALKYGVLMRCLSTASSSSPPV